MTLNLKIASFGAASALALVVFADAHIRAGLADASLASEARAMVSQGAEPVTPLDVAGNNQEALVSEKGSRGLTAQGAQGSSKENLLQLVTLTAVLFLGMGGIIALRRKQLDMETFQSISTDF